MNKKIFLWVIAFILGLSPVMAQTGLFDSANSGAYISIGVLVIVIGIIVRQLFIGMKNVRK